MFENDAISRFLAKIIPQRVNRLLAVGSPEDFPFIEHLSQFGAEFVYLKIEDLESANLDKDSFDLIFLYEIIYRLQTPMQSVAKFKSLLKPAGVLIAIEANWRCPYTFLVNINDKSKRKLYTLWPGTFKEIFSCLQEVSITMDSSVFHGGHSGLFFVIFSMMHYVPFLKNIIAPRYIIRGRRQP